MALPKSIFVAFVGLSCFLAASAAEGPTNTVSSNAEGKQTSSVDPSQQVGPQGSGAPPVGVYPSPYPYLPQGPYPGQYVPQPGPYGPYMPYIYMPQSGPYPYPYPYGPGPYVMVSETKTIDKDGVPTKQNVITSAHYGSALSGQLLNNVALNIGK